MTRDETIIDQAINWHLRQDDLADADWPQFVAWLEADPDHARVYDAVALQDRAIAAAQYRPLPANDEMPAQRWPLWLGAAAAAVAVVAISLPMLSSQAPASRDIATGPGARRSVAMADGTRIDLSGDTRIRLAGLDARSVELVQGEIMLRVRHNAAAPFVVTSGGIALHDLGTVFDVARSGAQLQVDVAEGAVLFQPGGAALTLKPGDSLVVREDRGTALRRTIAPSAVGGWKTGQLSFDNAPLGDVATAIYRLYGTDLVMEDDLSARPFTGMVKLAGAADRDIPHLAALIGANWRRDGKHWVITNRSVPPR